MEEADRLCSRLAIIDEGRVVVDGRPAELKAAVGADTVVLRIGRHPEAERAAGHGEDDRTAEFCSLLEGMVPCDAVATHDGTVTLAVADASAAIPGLLRRLDGQGFDVTGLQMSQPSLDDVFLQYTGRHIREEAADQPIIMGF
jgi:ABC-2 type transport system ATP-binding protein